MQFEKMKSRDKLSKKCSIHGKNREISGRIISEHLLKAIFLMFGMETVGPWLVWNLKWGLGDGHSPLPPPHPTSSGYAPAL